MFHNKSSFIYVVRTVPTAGRQMLISEEAAVPHAQFGIDTRQASLSLADDIGSYWNYNQIIICKLLMKQKAIYPPMVSEVVIF